MAEHLSDLRLDELASGLEVPDDVREHARTCPRCAQRLASLQSARTASEQSFGYARTRQRLLVAKPPRFRWARWAAPLALVAAAAMVTLFVLPQARPAGEDVRLKGRAGLELLDASGSAVTQATPGEVLTLAAGTGEHRHLLVFGIEEDGAVSRVWPPQGEQSGRLDPGARVRLEPPFEVTPGSVLLIALFSSEPLQASFAEQQVAQEVARVVRRQESPLEAQAPEDVADETARLLLRVPR